MVMSMTVDDVVDVLRDSSVPIAERVRRVGEVPDIRALLAQGLNDAEKTRDWRRFERLLTAAAAYPDRSYAPAIRRALALRDPEVPIEDALDVLAEIGDPGTLDVLREFAFADVDWDEFHHVNAKAIGAVKAIDTPEARDLLVDVALHGPEDVRYWAVQALDDAGLGH
jgi:hypothetical protein